MTAVDSHRIAWLLEVQAASGTRRWCSLGETLAFDGENWEGTLAAEGPMMLVEAPEVGAGSVDRRATITVGVTNESLRRMLSADLGAVVVKIRWLYSADGVAWTELWDSFEGRLSEPVIAGGLWRAEVETPLDDVDRGRIRLWSHQFQQSEDALDHCFENARSIATTGLDFVW